MPRSEERVNVEAMRLQRYLDGELTPDEAATFRARLAESPELRRELEQLRRVGAAVRVWSDTVETGAADLLQPTLARVAHSDRKRARQGLVGYALAAVVLVALPWAHPRFEPAALVPAAPAPRGAAIERVEATDRQAQVFVVGSDRTPVVWLADDGADASEQDPG